ncbi:MAG: DUF2933 domain-containing protein [ANME-2 cluster archaeon]|nr:DUF2933 domain-containing protein [ANME-2 cluster archaeon]
MKHSWLMMAACMLPIILVAGMWMLGYGGSWLTYAILLLCPLSHILMMRGNEVHDGTAAHEENGQ